VDSYLNIEEAPVLTNFWL